MKNSMRSLGRRLPTCIATACLLALGVHVLPVHATPFTWNEKFEKPPAWPKKSTLNVFIEKDPENKGRDELLKEGVERWKDLLKERMITLKVSIGDPPADTKNVIQYHWVNDGTTVNIKTELRNIDTKITLEKGTNDGAAFPTPNKDGTKLKKGDAFIRKGLPAKTNTEKEIIKTIGQHEFVHLLGLADDKQGDVTKHENPSTTFSTHDIDELNSLYGTKATGGAGKPKGNVQKSGGGGGMGFFQYHFDFKPANAVADPNDPEHIAFIALGIAPQFVTGLKLPPGWVGLVPTGPVSIDDPFFADGYMVDGAGIPPPWEPGAPPFFVALRTSTTEAALDGLPPAVDPGLTLENPGFDLTVFTRPGLRDGLIPVWAGGELQTVPGPISEPGTLALMSLGVIGLGGMRRRKNLR